MLEAYRTGETWALDEISESVEFYNQLFRLPEYYDFDAAPKPKAR